MQKRKKRREVARKTNNRNKGKQTTDGRNNRNKETQKCNKRMNPLLHRKYGITVGPNKSLQENIVDSPLKGVKNLT